MSTLNIVSIVIGWIAFFFSCAYSIPQFITIKKTRNTKGLSIPSVAFFIFCGVVMFCWGIGNACRGILDPELQMSMPVVILTLLPHTLLNLGNAILNTISLTIKIRNIKLAKKMGIDEIELARILKQKSKKRKAGK